MATIRVWGKVATGFWCTTRDTVETFHGAAYSTRRSLPTPHSRSRGPHAPATLHVRRSALHCAPDQPDRKSTRLNSSHSQISYAVFCLKKKKKEPDDAIYSRRGVTSVWVATVLR